MSNQDIQIVYNEKAVEDLLADDCVHWLGIQFVARQFRTPVGIVDVIAKEYSSRPYVYYVIEIKKGAIDAAAFVQAKRYAKWLNSEMSKQGRRLFIPVLIGSHLASDLIHICDYFEAESCSIEDVDKMYYRLFNFDPRSGVSFEWHSTAERDYKQTLDRRYCHINDLAYSLENAHHELYLIHRETQTPIVEVLDEKLSHKESHNTGRPDEKVICLHTA